MIRWEYNHYFVWPWNKQENIQKNLDRFNELGLDGWELVGVTDGVAYFRRPIAADWVKGIAATIAEEGEE